MPYPHMPNMLFFAAITGRPVPPEIMFAYHAMAYPMNYNHMQLHIREKPIDEARNIAADYARHYKCKYIFMWDEDVACPPQTLPELVYKMEHHPEAAAIGGVYCLKREPSEPLLFRGNGNGAYWDWKVGEFFEVSGIGMGCTLIRTEVFADLKKPWFKTEFNYERMMDGTAGLESWTEDLWFCQRITDTGKWKIYADGSLICTHYDPHTGKGYTLPPDSKPMRHLQVKKGKKKILDLGSGDRRYETNEGVVVYVDEDDRYPTDYRCDLRKLPFDNGSFDVVFSAALERFPAQDVGDILKEWRRVLKPGGEIRLVVSNVEHLAAEVLARRAAPHQLFLQKRAFAYNAGILMASVKEAGFEKVESVKSDPAHIGVRGRRT